MKYLKQLATDLETLTKLPGKHIDLSGIVDRLTIQTNADRVLVRNAINEINAKFKQLKENQTIQPQSLYNGTGINVLNYVKAEDYDAVTTGQKCLVPYLWKAVQNIYQHSEYSLANNKYAAKDAYEDKRNFGGLRAEEIYIPGGSYLMTETFPLLPGIRLKGAAFGLTKIFPTLEPTKSMYVDGFSWLGKPHLVAFYFSRNVKYKSWEIAAHNQGLFDLTIAPDPYSRPTLPILFGGHHQEPEIKRCNIQSIRSGLSSSLMFMNWEDTAKHNGAFPDWYEELPQDPSLVDLLDGRIEDNQLEGGEIVQSVLTGQRLSFTGNKCFYTSCGYRISTSEGVIANNTHAQWPGHSQMPGVIKGDALMNEQIGQLSHLIYASHGRNDLLTIDQFKATYAGTSLPKFMEVL